jgi:serine/threonine protein kinase
VVRTRSDQQSRCYAAFSRQHREIFAVKVIATSKSNNCPECEINALHHLSCPNVIYFYDFMATPLFQYIVFEFCPVGTILDVVR